MTLRDAHRKRSGYLYTVSIIILMIPLILLILFYTGTMSGRIDDTSARVRCDELYYFVQDIEHDLERAMLIFGRRAAIYAIDDVVSNNRTMHNYTFRNCTDYVFEGNGSEAAIAELVLCGTLYGEDVAYMINHTLPVWLGRIDSNATAMNYEVTIDVLDLAVLPYDAWNFAMLLELDVAVEDLTGLCYYEGFNKSLMSLTDIMGLEDPLYPLNTNNRMVKYFDNCTPDVRIEDLAGCSTEDWGEGTSSGNVVFYSNIKDDPGLGDFCAQTPDVNEVVLAMDMAFGACNGIEYNCFNISHPDHLAGVIDYAKNDPESSFVGKCNVTIPWISATGKIDNETQQGVGHQRDPDCYDGDIGTGQCVVIDNIPGCGIHRVLLGYNSEDLNTSCYVVSNITQYRDSCPGEEHPDGPSFFDRLDGRLNLSDKYAGQAAEHFGDPYIGIETLVNLYLLEGRGLEPDVNATWSAYLYWAGETGCAVGGACKTGEYDFKLDCPHAYFYELDTSCVNASGVAPVSAIAEPANDTAFPGCPAVNITGTADDCDGSVAYVEAGVNGVWHNTTWDGLHWNCTFLPGETNIYTIRSRAVDNDGIVEQPSGSVVVFVSDCSMGDNGAPTAPSLFSPSNGSEEVPVTPDFYWDDASDPSGIYRYRIQVDKDPPDWAPADVDEYAWGTEHHQQSSLTNNDWYAWRVRAQDGAGNWGPWSEVWTFKT